MDRFAANLKRLLGDRRSGSSAIAAKYCRICLREIRRPGSGIKAAAISNGAEELVSGFPTMALLRTLQDRLHAEERIRSRSRPQLGRLDDLLSSFINELMACRRNTASRFAATAGRHTTFLTLSASGAVLEACHVLAGASPKRQSRTSRPAVIVCESRPAREGIAMAHRLLRAGCAVTLITDAAIGRWIEEADAVLLGADWIDREGFINKTGSLALSKLARFHKKPVYVIGDTLRIRRVGLPKRRLPDADPAELLTRRERGLKVENRYFEWVPWNPSHVLVTGYRCLYPSRPGSWALARNL